MRNSLWCDHVQFYVRDARTAAAEFSAAYGFAELLGAPAGPARSVVLGQGSIALAFTEPPDIGPGRDFLAAHGDGLARIGFACEDLREVYSRAVAGGARVIEPPRRFGAVRMAAL